MRHPASTVILPSAVIVTGAACGSTRSGTSALPTLPAVQAIPRSPATTNPDIAPNGGRNLTTIRPSTPAPAPTSAAGSGDCTFEANHASTGPALAGITDRDLRCAGDWASWVGQAHDPATSDGSFAVAKRTATERETVNFGTAGVCADGGAPQKLWTALNCVE